MHVRAAHQGQTQAGFAHLLDQELVVARNARLHAQAARGALGAAQIHDQAAAVARQDYPAVEQQLLGVRR
jgi:hypothetical protein